MKGVKSGTVDSTQTESTMPLVEPVNPKVDLPEDVERQAQQTRCLPRGLQSGAENISSQVAWISRFLEIVNIKLHVL